MASTHARVIQGDALVAVVPGGPSLYLRRCHFGVGRGFDGDGAQAGEATGFIVDLERGLILTNKHVVTLGPVAGTVSFYNKEEVEAVPVYRDPIHDFGLYRVDPKTVKYAQLKEIPLRPEEAKVGAEIRVIGVRAENCACCGDGPEDTLRR